VTVDLRKPELPTGWPPRFYRPLRWGTVRGVDWAIQKGGVRGMRTINGYARIPWEGHPWSGITSYSEIEDQVAVHGGLTYGPKPEFDLDEFARAANDLIEGLGSKRMEVELEHEHRVLPATTFRDTGGWIGFDTGHAWDAWSVQELARWGIEQERIGIDIPVVVDEHTIWWTGERVIGQAKLLAVQIAAAGLPTKEAQDE